MLAHLSSHPPGRLRSSTPPQRLPHHRLSRRPSQSASRHGPWPHGTPPRERTHAATSRRSLCGLCGPRLGCDAPRARFPGAADLQTEAGRAPGTARSGTPSWGHGRRPWPQCLRHTVGAGAAAATRQACWAQGSAPPPREPGKAPQAAGRALAFPGLRLRSRCWQARPPEEASGYRPALQRRSALLLHQLAEVSCKK